MYIYCILPHPPPTPHRGIVVLGNIPIWFGTLERAQPEVFLDMLECTTGLRESLVGAEGTNALVYEGVARAEGPEHFSRYRAVLLLPLIAVYYCIEGIEEPHVDRFVELPWYCEFVLGVQCGEGVHSWLICECWLNSWTLRS